MSLLAGTRLGSYEITAQIGVGGMGEVYRATDTNLKRDVAIKVLPEAFAGDAERLARFEREARTLASLNHPHIAQIHGFEKSAGVHALVMELVEGPTLADRIARGAIPVDEALPIAKQIAEALEAAHEQGIIHRDLKPANIKVRNDGTVKVLDFGLAKAMDLVGRGFSPAGHAGSEDPAYTHSPTITSPALVTGVGVLLGTAAYMAPEQARGKAVDKRADIWAFGCVLYEMLTGRRAFPGEDVTDTLALVVRGEPDWSRLPAALPPSVGAYLKRSLQKDPRQRVADAQDLRLALEGAFDTASATPAAAARIEPVMWRRMLPLGVAAAAAFLLSGLTAWALWPGRPAAGVTRFVHTLRDDQALRNTGRQVVALSPDGQRFVYNTSGGLYLREMDSLQGRLIPGTEAILTLPVFSPDGASVAYWDQAGQQLKRIAIGGGAAVVIADGVRNVFGMSWGDDGTILYADLDGIYRVPATGGTPQRVISAVDGEQFDGPWLLPDGSTVLFTVTTALGPTRWDSGMVVAQSLVSGERTVLVDGGSDARYVPTGHIVYARASALVAVPFDLRTLTVLGGAVPLVQGMRRASNSTTAAANYGVSDSGTLLYLSGSAATLKPVWVDASGRVEPTSTPAGAFETLSLSPDGARAALGGAGDSGNADIWVSDLTRGTLERFTTEPSQETSPLWSPDGRRIAYVTDRSGAPEVVWRNADGTGTVETLLPPNREVSRIRLSGWSPDGTLLAMSVYSAETQDDVGVVTVGDPASLRFVVQSPAQEGTSAISPDGRWLAYTSTETGGFEIYVQRFPDGGSRQQVSIGNGFRPLWSSDGRTLYYQRSGPASGPIAAARVTVTASDLPEGEGSVLRFGAPSDMFPWNFYMAANVGNYWDLRRDDERFFVLGLEESEESANGIVVVENWFEELRRLVPAN